MTPRKTSWLALLVLAACECTPPPPVAPSAESAEGTARVAPEGTARAPAEGTAEGRAGSPQCAGLPGPALRHPEPPRLVAIGDLHGDLDATRAALRLAGAIDAQDAWTGGDLVVVQTGDVFDRGDDELEIERLFDRLVTEARDAGGAIHRLLGNHELMNASGDFRYVTEGGFADYQGYGPTDDPALARAPAAWRGRIVAFRPGAPVAMELAHRNVVEVVGDTVFVHGGLLPQHVAHGLELLNHEVACWLAGATAVPPIVADPESPVWTRVYATDPVRCDLLQQTLAAVGAHRMVIGHTPQAGGITSDCDGALWRIDVGMAAAYGGPVEVLEIVAGRSPRALR